MWYFKVLIILIWIGLFFLYIFRHRIFRMRNKPSIKYDKKDDAGNLLLEVFTFQKNNPLEQFGFLKLRDGLDKMREILSEDKNINIGFAYAPQEFMELVEESVDNYSIRLCFQNEEGKIEESSIKELTLNQLERAVEIYYSDYDSDIEQKINNSI